MNDDEEEEEEEEDDDDDEDESGDEQPINDLSKTIFNIQPSAYYTANTHVCIEDSLQILRSFFIIFV